MRQGGVVTAGGMARCQRPRTLPALWKGKAGPRGGPADPRPLGRAGQALPPGCTPWAQLGPRWGAQAGERTPGCPCGGDRQAEVGGGLDILTLGWLARGDCEQSGAERVKD